MKKLLTSLISAFFIFTSLGCGGGGGSSGDDTPPTLDLLKITSENADLVSGVTFASILLLSDLQYSVPDTLDASLRSSGMSGVTPDFLDIYHSASALLTKGTASTNEIELRATITESCPSGGTLVINYDFGTDGVPNEAGEYYQEDYNNCYVDSSGFIDGQMKFIIASWNSDLDFSINTTFDILFNYEGYVESFDGGIGTTIFNNGDSSAVTADRFSYTYGGENITFSDLNATFDSQASGTEASIAYDISSTEAGGSLIISTEIPLFFELYDYYPTVGTVKASGAENTYVSLDADTGDYNTVYQTIYDGASAVSNVIDWSTLESYMY